MVKTSLHITRKYVGYPLRHDSDTVTDVSKIHTGHHRGWPRYACCYNRGAPTLSGASDVRGSIPHQQKLTLKKHGRATPCPRYTTDSTRNTKGVAVILGRSSGKELRLGEHFRPRSGTPILAPVISLLAHTHGAPQRTNSPIPLHCHQLLQYTV